MPVPGCAAAIEGGAAVDVDIPQDARDKARELGWEDGLIELALFGGDYQEGVFTAYCAVDDVPHIELNGHILIPLQNVASLHCTSRCDAPEPDWPPRGLTDEDRDDEP